MNEENQFVENFYQGIFLTETKLGNPNGDFLDNSPRNFDGVVFTTDKCIKYNIRKYIHDELEDYENKENIVFFYPRESDDAEISDPKFKTLNTVYNDIFNKKFDELVEKSVDVRMFGGTFAFQSNNKQIYGPIQISYGLDINNAKIIPVQIGSPFASAENQQKTNGLEYVVDDAIISYDISINPNNYPELLLKSDLEIFKKALWFGTNSRKSSSKKTDSKFLLLIKFNNNSNSNLVSVRNIGELNRLISVKNKKEHILNNEKLELDCSKLFEKLKKYDEYIDSIEMIYDSDDIEINGEDYKYFNSDENKKIETPMEPQFLK